jgi:hypothetical protein
LNDFTKEELEDIANWGEVYTEFGHSSTDKIYRTLINKIQSMIDSYCEHEGEMFDSESHCVKCGKLLE